MGVKNSKASTVYTQQTPSTEGNCDVVESPGQNVVCFFFFSFELRLIIL